MKTVLLVDDANWATAAAKLRGARWRHTRVRLFDLEFDAEIAEIRQRLETARMRRRHHDLVNAFTAVEGAALIMARETLTAADRSMLNSLLGSGLTRLRELLVAVPAADHVALGDVAKSLAEDPRWHGRVQVDVAPDLVVEGSSEEIGEAIHQLLIYVVGRSPGSPVAVHAHPNGDHVELSVEDQGPQFSARERAELLDPNPQRWLGRKPKPGPGPHVPVGAAGPLGAVGSLGPLGPLHVAVRLARGQGGEVTVAGRPGGGESFRISWPAHVG